MLYNSIDILTLVLATCVYILFSGYRYGVWLGFHDMHQEGNYVTLSSGAGKFCYSNWHRGEPNNYGKSEHCATFRSTTRTWNDAHCKEIMNYICKK